MIQSVSIDGKDLYTEYGCILASKEIGQPSPQTKYVEVPLRDGAIDLTEVLTDSIKYDNRIIKLTFLYLGENKSAKIADLSRAFHGKKLQIIFSDDLAFYYLGRISIDSVTNKNDASKIVITAECDPFKYDVSESDLDWEWDTLDFEEGIINEAGALIVNGSKSFTLICRRMREFPVFTASTTMTMTYKGKVFSLKAGEQKLYNVFFDEGENQLTFSGNGTVSIKYRGGSL